MLYTCAEHLGLDAVEYCLPLSARHLDVMKNKTNHRVYPLLMGLVRLRGHNQCLKMGLAQEHKTLHYL